MADHLPPSISVGLQSIAAIRAFPPQDYTLSVRDLFQESLSTIGTENLLVFRLLTSH